MNTVFETIYDAELIETTISGTFIAICIAFVLCFVYLVKSWNKYGFLRNIPIIVVDLILLIIMLSLFYQNALTNSLYEQYINGTYETVEGFIEDYESEHTEDIKSVSPDRFCVNDILFYISDEPFTGYGYNVRKADGGALDNGAYVKICYVKYGSINIIMKLEKLLIDTK